MSIQDDYFNLCEATNLTKYQKKCLERIWEWGVDNENENEKLRPIVNGLRNSLRSLFEEN